MKNLKLILAATVATASLASAHQTPNALVDDSGSVVKGDFGQCIEAQYNDANAACGKSQPVQPDKIHEFTFNMDAKALFDTAKAIILPAGRTQLTQLANRIKEGTQLGQIKRVTAVNVIGHTDSRGSVPYNQGLSERRAASVRNFLIQQGISASMINAHGEGELNPIATNATPAGRQQNRRVEVHVQGVAQKK